jgi:rare lipoprotein A
MSPFETPDRRSFYATPVTSLPQGNVLSADQLIGPVGTLDKMVFVARVPVAGAAAALFVVTSLCQVSAECGRASWYARHSHTASGERMNPAALTAAHRTLPFGTLLRVTNQQNGKFAIVRINDRGPSIRSRIVDLSKGAAAVLGFVGSGHTSICTAEVGLRRM